MLYPARNVFARPTYQSTAAFETSPPLVNEDDDNNNNNNDNLFIYIKSLHVFTSFWAEFSNINLHFIFSRTEFSFVNKELKYLKVSVFHRNYYLSMSDY